MNKFQFLVISLKNFKIIFLCKKWFKKKQTASRIWWSNLGMNPMPELLFRSSVLHGTDVVQQGADSQCSLLFTRLHFWQSHFLIRGHHSQVLFFFTASSWGKCLISSTTLLMLPTNTTPSASCTLVSLLSLHVTSPHSWPRPERALLLFHCPKKPCSLFLMKALPAPCLHKIFTT